MGTLLLRISGVPLDLFMASANPALLKRTYHAQYRQRRMRDCAASLSRRLNLFINRQTITRDDSKLLGGVARRIAHFQPLREDDGRNAQQILARQNPRLAAQILKFASLHARLIAALREVEAEIGAEPARAADAVWRECRSDPWALALLEHRDPELLTRLPSESDGLEGWSTKSGRRRSERLSSIINRASFRTVPRDWHTIVSAIPVSADTQGAARLEGKVRVAWTENIDTMRKAFLTQEFDDDTVLGMAAVWSSSDSHVQFFAVDPLRSPELRSIKLRRTSLLDAVLSVLGVSAVPIKELRRRLCECLPPDDIEVLGGFVRYLAGIGIVHATRSPATKLGDWIHPGSYSSVGSRSQADGYIDVYGECEGLLEEHRAHSLERDYRLLGRLAGGLQRTDTIAIRHEGRGLRLLDLVCERFEHYAERTGEQSPSPSAIERSQENSQPATGSQDSAWAQAGENRTYDALIRLIKPRLSSSDPIILTSTDLDEAAAPEWNLQWPCDVMLRLGSGPNAVAVFEESFPAATMDARFVDGLRTSGLPCDQYDWYKTFLARLEQAHGRSFVELLFPPLTIGAANAVRRPAYVRHWTGDSDAATYFTQGLGEVEFVPLDRFTVSASKSRLQLLLDDDPFLPLYHATRMPIAPWSNVAEIFLNASPTQMRWYPLRLDRLLDAFPDERHAPRLQFEGGLAISCRQWRLSGLDLPPENLLHQIEAVTALRRALELPRMIFISVASGARPRACDLDSISGVAALCEATLSPCDPLAIEMTPGPDQLFVRHRGGARQSCSMLRLPLGDPNAFADYANEHLDP